jgi:hypothetical protein
VRRISRPFATRRYGVDGQPDREVTLVIGKPRPWRGDWACRFTIEGLSKPRSTRVYGVDSLQALQLALVRARHDLDLSGLPLTWLDGEPGDAGLPLPVPTGLGYEFQLGLERLVVSEQTKLEHAVTAFMKERRRRRKMHARRSSGGT